jgi:4-diphosphocytidyl-2-C-methyl-D-erythritol kinase
MSGPGPVLARAKLTLSLRVEGVRPDGYHLLDAEMVTLDLADTLYFTEGEGLEVVDGGAGDGGFGLAGVPAGPDNLVARALRAAGRRAHVRLVKRVPPGAGLGGGSADAAAVLRWAGLTGPEGVTAAAGLGSDVPFCLAGGGRARVGGAGDLLEPLPFDEVAGRAYTLLVPPFGVPTGAVYQAWDNLGGPRGGGPNDLEVAALQVEPRLAHWGERLAGATGQVPVLAGSGSTWFVPGAYPGEGRIVARVDGG